MLLDGAPILLHTIRKFLHCPSVSEIVVALRREDLDWARGLVHQDHPNKPVRFVEGGDSRQQSVENALAALTPETDVVAVHDAVRPFIDSELVEKVIAEAARSGAAIVGIVPIDTVKRVHKNKIRDTLPRENLVLAQTPQVFRSRAAEARVCERAARWFQGTDEASLVERMDVEVGVVGAATAISDHSPTDMDLARLFYPRKRRGEPRRECSEIRTSLGWDSHHIAAGRPLISARHDSFGVGTRRPLRRRHPAACGH
jgi:2-C-methyl-D-erythritol 4-phosphate cytidylyltransferase